MTGDIDLILNMIIFDPWSISIHDQNKTQECLLIKQGRTSASTLLYNIIETAEANGLELYSYLRYMFEKLPLAKTLEDYEALLPWNLRTGTLALAAVKGRV